MMKRTIGDIVFDSVKVLFLSSLLVVTLYPFLNIAALSFNDALDSVRGGITLWPRKFSLYNYHTIFSSANILHAAMISVLRTVVAAVLQVFCNAMVAYALSRKEYVLRKAISILYVITMYVSGGLIPTYLLIRWLGMINTFTVYWLPGLTGAFNILVIRTYIHSLPEGLVEAARMEGANEFYVFIKIILPLALPVIATITLFTAVGQWNAWFDTFLYNSSKPALSTLQYELMKKLQSANAALSGGTDSFSRQADQQLRSITPKALRAAMTIIVSLPIICVYPFLQRYFIKGLTIGSLKG